MSENIGRYNVILELITEQRNNRDTLNKVQQDIGGINKGFGTMKTVLAGLGGMISGFFSIQLLSKFSTQLYDVTKKYEQYSTILKVATGSQKESNKVMAMIEKTAASTTFSVDELTASYIKFANRGIRPTESEIISLADLAASQGKKFDQLTEAVLDAMTGEYERLKEFGIRATQQGDKVQLTFRGVNKVIAKTPEAIQKAVIELGNLKGVAGANAEQMSTLNGIVSNTGDNIEKGFKNLGNRLKSYITSGTSAIAELAGWFAKITEISLADTYRDEQVQLSLLVSSITDVNVHTDTRKKLIGELNEKYPFFLKNLDAEKVTNEQLAKRMSVVNELYDARIRLQIQEDKIKDLREKKAKIANAETEQRATLEQNIAEAAAKFNIDITKATNTEERRKVVMKELLNIQKTTYEDVSKNWSALNYRRKIWTENIRLGNDKRRTNNSDVNDELQFQLKILQDIQKETGWTTEELNKFFDGENKTDQTKPTAPAKTKEQIEKEMKQRQQKMLDDLEKYYLQKELAAKKEITDAELLSNKLQEIEYEKNLALLRLKKSFVKSNSKDAAEYENQIYDTEKAFKDFMYGMINKIPEAKRIEAIWEKQTKSVNGYKEELDLLVKSLENLRLGPNAKNILKQLGLTENDAKQNAEKQLEQIANRIKTNIIDPLENKGKKDKKPFLQSLFGMSDEQYDDFTNYSNEIINNIERMADAQIEATDRIIESQEKRVAKATELAEKGKVDQLRIEEARLSELQKKRDNYVKLQRAMALAEIIQSNSVSAAKSVEAISKAFAAGGPAGIITGTVTSIALAAQIGAIILAVKNSFSSLPAFSEGIKAFGISDNGLVTGQGTGKSDSVLARLSRGERVVDEETNRAIGYSTTNDELLKAVNVYKNYPVITDAISRAIYNVAANNSDIKNELVQIKNAIESIKITTKLDKDGFVQDIIRNVDSVTRRKKIIG